MENQNEEKKVVCFRCGLEEYESVMNKIGSDYDESRWLCDSCKDKEIN